MTGNENTWETAVQQLVPTIICSITIIIQIIIIIQIRKNMIYHRSVLHSNQSHHDTVLGATHRGLQSESAAEVHPSSHGERVRHFSSLRSDSLQMTKKPSPAPVQTPCHRCVCDLSSTAARDRTLSPPLTKLLRARHSHRDCL